jgi:hypothetical protein
LKGDGSGFTFALVPYFGYKAKWDNISMFFDLGLGWSYTTVSLSNSDSIDSDLEQQATGRSIAYDLNLGIGYSF